MAGRFSDWELPNDILQNHIINYYKDSNQPELIEKIITNLCLKECPKPIILELIQFSEQNFLSSALLYLHTAVFDTKEDASCIHVILALLHLYRQARNTTQDQWRRSDVSRIYPLTLLREYRLKNHISILAIKFSGSSDSS